jgi:hypothetical protein
MAEILFSIEINSSVSGTTRFDVRDLTEFSTLLQGMTDVTVDSVTYRIDAYDKNNTVISTELPTIGELIANYFLKLLDQIVRANAFGFDTDVFNLVRTKPAADKKTLQKDLWKNKANRDVFRILHKGK